MEDTEVDMRGYGTPDSWLLAEVRKAGHNPIGITVMLCEETFIFKTPKEATDAWNQFAPEGWWYGVGDFVKEMEWYIDTMYKGIADDAPVVYWFDNNYKKIKYGNN